MAARPASTSFPAAAPIPERALRRWDWILGIGFLLLYWAVALGAGVKGLVVLGGLISMAIAFFFPKIGIYGLTFLMSIAVSFLIIASVALIPANRGDPSEKIGWQILYDIVGMLAVLGVVLALWLGAFFRRALTGLAWHLTPLEESLAWMAGIATAWIGFSISNEIIFYSVAFDYGLIVYYTTAILVARTLKSESDWLTFFYWLLAGVFLHWLIMLADLVLIVTGGTLTNPLYITDTIRHTIGGSPDLAGTFVPILVALLVCSPPARAAGRWVLLGLILIFTFHNFASLFRSAAAQYVLSLLILAYLLNRSGERRAMGQVLLRVMGVLVVMLAMLAVAQPTAFKYLQAATLSRIAEVDKNSGSTSQMYDPQLSSQGEVLSNKHRELETAAAVEDLSDQDWLTGRGPGAFLVKRFWASAPGREELYLHNGFLWYILKFGIVGILLIFWAYYRFFAVAVKAQMGRDLEPWMRALTVGYVAAVIPMVLFAWTNNIIGQPGGLYFLMPAFAWMCFVERTQLGKRSEPAAEGP